MTEQDKNRQDQSGFWFLVGAAVGVAAGFYLNSDKGRRLRREAGDQISEYGQSVSRSASGSARRVQTFATDVGTAIRQQLDTLSETTESLRARLEEQLRDNRSALRGKAKRLEEKVKKHTDN